MLRRVELCQEELFLLVFILVSFFQYLRWLKGENAVAVARKSSPNCCVVWWPVCKFPSAWEQCVHRVSWAPHTPALHIAAERNCSSLWWSVRGLQTVLSAPKVASIWGLAWKDSGHFSSLFLQVGSHLSLGIPLCAVGQTHGVLCLAAPQRSKLLSQEFQRHIL